MQNGHFDFEIYYNVCNPSGGYRCARHTHVHQYDDKYNVTGVDMQNASLTAFNLSNAIPGTGTKFKILVANQSLSRAVKLKIGDTSAGWQPAVSVETCSAAPPSGSSFVNSLTTYSRGGVTNSTKLANLYLAMPLDAFAQRDWTNYWATDSTASRTPANNSWSCVGSMASNRTYHTATFIPAAQTLPPNDRVLVTGGWVPDHALPSAEIYNIAPPGGITSWTQIPDMSTARYQHTATLLPNGKVLVIGGYNGTTALSSA